MPTTYKRKEYKIKKTPNDFESYLFPSITDMIFTDEPGNKKLNTKLTEMEKETANVSTDLKNHVGKGGASQHPLGDGTTPGFSKNSYDESLGVKKLETPRAIDGVEFDGSANNAHRVTSSTAAATQVKVTNPLTGFVKIASARVTVNFGEKNTHATPKLDVYGSTGTTGAADIKYAGVTVLPEMLGKNIDHHFEFDGTDYNLLNPAIVDENGDLPDYLLGRGVVMATPTPPGEVKKGDIASMTEFGIQPSKIDRVIAHSITTGPTGVRYEGYLKLSNNKILLLWADRMVVATINWTAKSVTMGTYFTLPYSSPTAVEISNRIALLQNYDDGAGTAIVAMPYQSGTTCRVQGYRIINDVITAIASFWTSPALYRQQSNGYTNCVRVSSSEIMIVVGGATQTFAYVINVLTGTQVSVSAALNAALNTETYDYAALHSYDRGNGNCILVGDTSQNPSPYFYTLPIRRTGSTITLGTFTNQGAAQNHPVIKCIASHGDDKWTALIDKVVIISTTNFPAVAAPWGPATARIINISATHVVTLGSIINLPLHNDNAGISIRRKSDDEIRIIGGMSWNEFLPSAQARILDLTLSGVTIASTKKYRPFRRLVTNNTNMNAAGTQRTFGAFENEDNLGEYLLMEARSDSSLNNFNIWFGYITDVMYPDNIYGIATSNAYGGFVRVQTAGLVSGFTGLVTGQEYTLTTNGQIAPYTGAAGTVPIGRAVNATTLNFYGGKPLTY